jgi:hypothetical protein
MVTIDGDDVSSVTIDGEEVQEITVDGDIVFQATRPPIFQEDYEDGNDDGWFITSGSRGINRNVTTRRANSGSFSYELDFDETDNSQDNSVAIDYSGDYPTRFRFFANVDFQGNDDCRLGLHASDGSKLIVFNLFDEVGDNLEIEAAGFQSTSFELDLDEWFRFEVKNMSPGGTGDFSVEDSFGNTVFSGSVGLPNTTPGRFQVNFSDRQRSGSNSRIYIDDILVD